MSVQTSELYSKKRFYVQALRSGSEGQIYYFSTDRALGCIIGTFDSKENAELFCEAKTESLKKYLT